MAIIQEQDLVAKEIKRSIKIFVMAELVNAQQMYKSVVSSHNRDLNKLESMVSDWKRFKHLIHSLKNKEEPELVKSLTRHFNLLSGDIGDIKYRLNLDKSTLKSLKLKIKLLNKLVDKGAI
jgi:hypothetical protein